jgi:uncharacterized protein DUF3105
VPNKPTKKDRREATKAARFEAEQRAQKQRRMRFLYVGIGAAAFVALIVGIVLFSGTKPVNVAALNNAAKSAGCGSIQTFPNQGQTHVAQGTIVQYNSNPPTSGSHYQVVAGVVPAPTGVHTAPIQNEIQVHNLEHGHIGIQYAAALPTTVVNALETFARNHDTYVFMAPRPDLPAGVQLAFSRWQNLVDCASPTDASAVVAFAQKFYDAYHGLGPEGGIPGTPIS